MSRIKTFAKYAVWVILFFVFSNILIFVGLNSTYKNMEASATTSNLVNIKKAESTSVNGRIYGSVTNTAENNLTGKYIRIDIYSQRNVLLATKFLEIGELAIGSTDNFEIYFKTQNAKLYNISVVDTMENTDANYSVFSSEEYRQYQIIYWVIVLMLFK